MTRQTFSSTARVGVLVVVAIALLYAGFIFLGGRFQQHGTKYYVSMSDAGGVVKGTRISMAGVHIGQVDDVQLVTPKLVRVTISIDEKYKLPAGSVAEIPVQFISIGEAGMVIVPPETIVADLPPGSTIQGRHPGPIDAIFPDSQKTIEAVKKTIETVNQTLTAMRDFLKDEDLKGNVKRLLASSTHTADEFAKLANSANSLLVTNQSSISKAVTNAEMAMTDVRKSADLVYKLVHDGHYQDQATELLKRLDETSAKASKLMDSLNAYVSDPAMHDTLNATLQNAKEISEQGRLMATKMNTIVDNGTVVSSKAIQLTDQATAVAAEAKKLEEKLEGLVDKVEGKVDSVKIPKLSIGPIHSEVRAIRDTWPNYNRVDANFNVDAFGQLFYFGLYDAFASNKLDFQLGKRLGSDAVLRYGMYAGTEGVGVDYRIARRLGLETNVYNINKPRFDAYLKYDITDSFNTWIGMDRIFDRNGLAIGVGWQK